MSLPTDAYRRILVVDDHALVRAGLVQLLQRLLPLAAVAEAATRAAALAALAAQPDTALVTLDLTLPDSDRLALLRELRARWPALPVVVVSALEDPALATQALDIGAVAYVAKSSDAALMESALRVVLAGGSYVPPFLHAARQAPRAAGGLTERQREVLALLAQGLVNKDIARALGLSEATVKTHLVSIFRVLRVKTRAQALLAARDAALP